jgi:nitrite reductase/ring-hydroxylating ferredoxin subunit
MFFRIKGTALLLIRKNGLLYLLFAKCKHMGCPLSEFRHEFILNCPRLAGNMI